MVAVCVIHEVYINVDGILNVRYQWNHVRACEQAELHDSDVECVRLDSPV